MAHIEPHGWEMIPWLILSHVGDDVIKKNYEIKEKEWKWDSHTFGLRKGGGNFLLLTHTVNAPKRRAKRKEKKRRRKRKQRERKRIRMEKERKRRKKKKEKGRFPGFRAVEVRQFED